jgi:hypothetical protein
VFRLQLDKREFYSAAARHQSAMIGQLIQTIQQLAFAHKLGEEDPAPATST